MAAGDEFYVRDTVNREGYKRPDDASLNVYMAAVSAMYHEFEYPPKRNARLDSYFHKHPGADLHIVNLSTSINNLEPYQPAVRASTEAARIKSEALHGRGQTLMAELNSLGESAQYYSDTIATLRAVGLEGISYVSTEDFVGGIISMFSHLKPEVTELVKEKYLRDGNKLPKALEECFDHKTDRGFTPKLPRGRAEDRAVRKAAYDLTIMLAQEILFGEIAQEKGVPSENLQQKAERLHKEALAEIARPKLGGKEMIRMSSEVIDKELTPAIIHNLLEPLHSMKPDDVKAKNLVSHAGSSTFILEKALDVLADKPKGRLLRKKPEKKALLMFAMSWDGMKAMASGTSMEPSIISGPVNADMLEAHLKHAILKDKFANDLPHAREEIKRRVGALVLNIPENPLGKIPSDGEMHHLAEVIKKYDLPVVISDELYAVPGHRSLLTYPGMEKHCYLVSSTSKNIRHKGKLAFGYTANDEFARRMDSALREEDRPSSIQAAGFAALIKETPLSYYQGNQEQYARKRRLMSQTMQEVNKELGLEHGVSWMREPDAGCLGVLTVSKELTDAAGIHNSCELAEYLYKLGAVETTATGDVGGSHSGPIGVRVNFSRDDSELVDAVRRTGVAMQFMQHAREEHKTYGDIKGERYRGIERNHEGSAMLDMIANMLGGNVTIIDEQGRRLT